MTTFAIHSEKREMLMHSSEVVLVITGQALTKHTPLSVHAYEHLSMSANLAVYSCLVRYDPVLVSGCFLAHLS